MNIPAAINAGLFVQFVYDHWMDSGDATDLAGKQVLTSAGAPVVAGKSYTVKQTLYANDLATDIRLSTGIPLSSKTIGIVAINDADPADVCIAIRGTVGIWEWIQDAKFLPIPFKAVHGAGFAEDGFSDMYDSFSFTPVASSTFLSDIKALLPTNAMVTVAGHSLGAALSTLLSLDLAANSNLPVTSYTLASPRVGDLIFGHLFNHVVPNAYRIFNRTDVVPMVPTPPLYFHVGDETELVADPTIIQHNLACQHNLHSYLYMLAGLLGQTTQPLAPECVVPPTPLPAAVSEA